MNVKDKKGSITIFVLVGLLFMSGFLMLSYANNVNKSKIAKEQFDIINNIYQYSNEALEDATQGTLKVEDVKNTVISETTNTTVYDEYGNKIVVPAGFKIRVDEGTTRTKGSETSLATHVTEGIVIEHGIDGNQFVWVPVGDVYTTTDTEKTTSNTKTITLGRYSWSGSTGSLVQPTESNPYTSNVAITIGSYNFKEYQPTSTTNNAKARNINDFYESVMGVNGKEGNGGYYIGRFEAGDSDNREISSRTGTNGTSTPGTLVCKSGQVPYNWIRQANASSKCRGMYADGYKKDGTGTFSSDLINSYAWDTAIVFIQTFGKSDYAGLNEGTKGYLKTGANGDEYCNINDMSGNALEWSTETYSDTGVPCVCRGGYYYTLASKTGGYTRDRNDAGTAVSNSFNSFRPLLYVGL